jgi:hypothetical protein
VFQIQVHGSDLTSFYEQVPKEVLPAEYGGEAGSLQDHWGMPYDDLYDDFIFKAEEIKMTPGSSFLSNNNKVKWHSVSKEYRRL